MININDQLLDKNKVNEDELWLLLQITKRIRSDKGYCFPSIDTLCNDSGFGEKKVSKLKNALKEKGLIYTKPRYREDGGRTSDKYFLGTNLIGIFMGGMRLSELSELSTPPRQKEPTPPRQNGRSKLLTNEAINKVKDNSMELKSSDSSISELINEQITKVILELNEIAGRQFSPKTKPYRTQIRARMKEGARLEECIGVIKMKWFEWSHKPKMRTYVNPKTLFRASNFPEYLECYRRYKSDQQQLKDFRERINKEKALVNKSLNNHQAEYKPNEQLLVKKEKVQVEKVSKNVLDEMKRKNKIRNEQRKRAIKEG